MNTPTEYFGPHAKRWTHPDTGVTYSLKPRDYDQLVAEQRGEEQANAIADIYGVPVVKHSDWPNVISTDGTTTFETMDVEKTTAGELIVDGGFRTPEHQRYELEVESSPVAIPPEMADRIDAIVYGATRGGIKYPTPAEAVAAAQAAADTAFVAARIAEDARDKALADAGLSIAPGGGLIPQPSTVRFLSLVEDDTFGCIRPVEQTAPGAPAARHFKRRGITRNLMRLGLVYIIAIIGVAAVAGVIS